MLTPQLWREQRKHDVIWRFPVSSFFLKFPKKLPCALAKRLHKRESPFILLRSNYTSPTTGSEMDDTLHSRIREQLHGVGLRMTPTRAALLRLLLELGGPITHADIVDRLSAEFVDRSTVFRVLQDFISAGLVRRLDIGDHKWRYELIRESALSESDSPLHPHLLCDECGKVFCLSEEEVQFSVPATGLVVREVLLRGSCTDCFANSQSAGSERGNQK